MRGQRGDDAGDRMLRRHNPGVPSYVTQDAGRGEERGVEPVRVALLGCGVVGTEVARNLPTHASELAQRVGAPLELAGIAVRRPGRRRGLDFAPAPFTPDPRGLG